MASIPQWQCSLIEAMTAASELISEDTRKDFVVIGGAALVQHVSIRKTQDVDIAITPETLWEFYEHATSDPQFSLHLDGNWVYTCQEIDVQVPMEFLSIGGDFVPKLHGLTRVNPYR